MNKKILGLLLLAALIIVPAVALGQGGTATGAGDGKAAQIADNVKALAVSIAIAIVVIGWIIAGILYLTSAGDPSKIQTAKKAMIAAVIGTALVVIAVAGYPTIEGIINELIKTN